MTESTLRRLDSVVHELGTSRADVVRRGLEAVLSGTPLPDVPTPTEDELLALLTEKARQGNVAAIRSLLVRIEERDPRARAIAELELLAQARRQ